jgi:hypothetical protein
MTSSSLNFLEDNKLGSKYDTGGVDKKNIFLR